VSTSAQAWQIVERCTTASSWQRVHDDLSGRSGAQSAQEQEDEKARRASIEKWEAFCKPQRTYDKEGVRPPGLREEGLRVRPQRVTAAPHVSASRNDRGSVAGRLLRMISGQTLRVCPDGKTGFHFSGSCPEARCFWRGPAAHYGDRNIKPLTIKLQGG
jgi:hypothetical protein